MNFSKFVLGIYAKASKTQVITDDEVIRIIMETPEAKSYKNDLERHKANGKALSKDQIELQLSMRFRYPASSILHSYKAQGFIAEGKITDRGKLKYNNL